MTYGTTGAGQTPHWSAVLFNSMARIKALEITYKTGPAAVIDVMAGRIDYYFATSGTAMANKSKLRALAVTSTTRSPVLPEVPSIAEAALPGYEMTGWWSIVGPAGMVRDFVDPLNAAIGRTLNMPDVRDWLLTAGAEATPSTPDGVARKYADWIERFGRIAKQAGIKPQ